MGKSTTLAAILGSAFFLSACETGGLDLDFRGFGQGLDTSNAARSSTASRPRADNRGIISYPNYQIAIARQGDNVATVASRIGLGPEELARHNGLTPQVALRAGEVLALPRRVDEPTLATGAPQSGPLVPGGVDITTLAGDAIDRAAPTKPGRATSVETAQGVEPIRHKVERGETAFTISRLYNVSVSSLAEWNGLDANMDVREGQFLLIPVVIDPGKETASTAKPGTGSVVPEPPSASDALPSGTGTPDVDISTATPDLSTETTSGGFVMPVKGSIIRAFSKGKNDGIDISAAPGTSVVASSSGTVAAITRDTDQVPIIVLRHADNILSVYAGLDNLAVEKGDSVKRGEKIGVVRDANPSFVHFEIRRGLDAIDPVAFIN